MNSADAGRTPPPVIEVRNLTMRFGKTVALDDLSFVVRRGDLYGLIGPNGAGKTTAFRILATVLRPTAGTVIMAGANTDSDAVSRETQRKTGYQGILSKIRRRIGYMPDTFGVYEDMTVEEYLTFFGAAYGITDPKRRRLVDDVLDLVDLSGKRTQLIETLSRGMQQRLGIARVLIHDPELLVLDEPASGLDPRARVEIRSLLLELQKMGKTILISSHILADLGEICNRVGIIEQGKLLTDGTLGEILGRIEPSTVVRLRVDDIDRAMVLLQSLPFVKRVARQNETVSVDLRDGFREIWRISKAIVDEGIQLNYIEQDSENLERAFMELTKGIVS